LGVAWLKKKRKKEKKNKTKNRGEKEGKKGGKGGKEKKNKSIPLHVALYETHTCLSAARNAPASFPLSQAYTTRTRVSSIQQVAAG